MKLKHLLLLACSSLTVFFTPLSMAASESEQTPTVQQTQVATAQHEQINLNTATVDQLQKGLVGIGAKKAQAIVEYREQHGPFVSLEQLTEVKGIGSAIFEKNKDRITIE